MRICGLGKYARYQSPYYYYYYLLLLLLLLLLVLLLVLVLHINWLLHASAAFNDNSSAMPSLHYERTVGGAYNIQQSHQCLYSYTVTKSNSIV